MGSFKCYLCSGAICSKCNVVEYTNDIKTFTAIIFYIRIKCITQLLYLAYFEFLHGYSAFARRQNFVKQYASFDFLPRKYDVIYQLRQSWAKDPFCLTRLTS